LNSFSLLQINFPPLFSGLFCHPNAQQQFTSMPSAPTGSMPPHLAASIAAGYGQRLMGGGHILHPQPQQNGSSTHRVSFDTITLMSVQTRGHILCHNFFDSQPILTIIIPIDSS